MRRKTLAATIACLAVVMSSQLGLARAGDLSSLLERSPFPTPTKLAPAVATASSTLELRSVLVERGQYVFSLYDATTKRSTWVRLNQPEANLVAKRYDRARAILALDVSGKPIEVALKSSRAGSPAGALAAAGPRTRNSAERLPGPLDLQPPIAPSEPIRVSQVSEQILRRRAQRPQPGKRS